ncbi:NAD(+) synthase [Candidatus Woesearchaeota archaeon]|nr:NAD(+) synthase [Candidatus Woesearchaeota archaeon]
MRIALAQMEVVPGRPKKNLETMLEMIEQAKEQKADLVVFPEMCLGGYVVGDKWLDEDFCRDLMSYHEDILKASQGIAIAYGNIFADRTVHQRVEDNSWHPNKDGRVRKYNAVSVVQNGKPVERAKETKILPQGVQPKTLLPNYRYFDDERYFFSLEDAAKDAGVSLEDLLQPFLIEVQGKKVPIGFEICEDLWCEDYRKNGKPLNPAKMLIENGAELVINLSASPWNVGKGKERDRRVKFLKQESGKDFKPFLYVNCVSVQNNGKNIISFDGGSTAYNVDGLPVKFAHDSFQQELLIVDDADFAKPPQEREELPKIAQKYDAIIQGIRSVKDTLGLPEHPRYVVGLSGGIDSAVVAALLVQAVGRDKVLAVNMPTRYNSDKTKQTAALVAERLGIAYEVIPIEDLVRLHEEVLERYDLDGSGGQLSELNQENIQAKIRGTSILSNIAAKYHALFTNNGNKLETALGYATLYGDVGGAIAPIGDLTKTEVVEMARYLNEKIFHDAVIPEILLPDALFRFRDDQIQPTAELKDNQIDPMKFGYHDALLEAATDYKKKTPEDVLQWYLDGTLEEKLGISTSLMERWGIDDPKVFVQDIEWFYSTTQRNVFKRIQAPPIIITSKSAYGFDIRESMLPWEPTRAYGMLKQKVLAMANTDQNLKL